MIFSVTSSDPLAKPAEDLNPASNPYFGNKYGFVLMSTTHPVVLPEMPHPEQTLGRNLLSSRSVQVKNFPLLMALSPADHNLSQEIFLKEMSLPVV